MKIGDRPVRAFADAYLTAAVMALLSLRWSWLAVALAVLCVANYLIARFR